MLLELKSCRTLHDVADLLDVPASTLSFLLYKLPNSAKYNSFCISKKNGKSRSIAAPEDRLKSLQRVTADVLSECTREIQLRHGLGAAYGFIRGRGIYENATKHRNKRWVFNIDLSDFFPSINFGRVRGFFLSNSEFRLEPRVATILAQISCWNNELPQGAPTSPIISNLVCGSLDYRLSRIAKRNKCSYTRYADDLTFSSNVHQVPQDIAEPSSGPQGWQCGATLSDVISASGFNINPSKTRMSFSDSRQTVTGLVVNSFTNSPNEDRRLCRASVHRLMRGESLSISRFCSDFSQNCPPDEPRHEPSEDALAVLSGKINHLHYIRNRSDGRSEKSKFFQPNSVAKTYRDFLIFKYFVYGNRPIILTEGPTDIIYIKSALLASPHPYLHLSEFDKFGKIQIKCQFFNFPKIAANLLGLTGGSGNIKSFVEMYAKHQSRLSNTVPHRPFIIVLDSDSGAVNPISAINAQFKTNLSVSDDAPFHVITRGTALVKSPLNGAKSSDIEHLLDGRLTTKPVNGRQFTSQDNYDISTNFGKRELSDMVYKQRAILDFSKVFELLERISNACHKLA